MPRLYLVNKLKKSTRCTSYQIMVSMGPFLHDRINNCLVNHYLSQTNCHSLEASLLYTRVSLHRLTSDHLGLTD